MKGGASPAGNVAFFSAVASSGSSGGGARAVGQSYGGGRSHPLDHGHGAEREEARLFTSQGGGEFRAVTEHGEDKFAHRRAVFRSRIAARARPAVEDTVGRSPGAADG
jgi:hypothetical protein